MLSCTGYMINMKCSFDYSVRINNEIAIDKDEFKSVLSTVLKQSKTSQNFIEIIVFGYSSGKEKYFFSESDKDNIITKILPGSFEVLLKIRYNNKLEKAVFINSYGNTMRENINDLAKKIQTELCD